MEQRHLDYRDTVNFGSYYTPDRIVDLVYRLLARNVPNLDAYTIVDSSCGCGNFLRRPGSIGADIDPAATRMAEGRVPDCFFYRHNSLSQVDRSRYGLARDDKIVLIGNPPYNDATSLIRNRIKEYPFAMDADLRTRDLGMSFLLSYDKLAADLVCVLHPLSYLIKKANFNRLASFREHYKLRDGLLISSGEFSAASKATRFPIIAALYGRDPDGMTYDFICDWRFKTGEGKSFRLNQFDKFGDYAAKYPNHKSLDANSAAAFFWTMRDINALKRTRTFIEREVYNSIRVPRAKLPYYCYADIFKDHIGKVPYYLGNCDVLIDHGEFEKIKGAFVAKSLAKYPFLRHLSPAEPIGGRHDAMIEDYFRNLLGEHYVA
jgi:hypothetical protein